jgi:outer membrane protein assembly factor BamB
MRTRWLAGLGCLASIEWILVAPVGAQLWQYTVASGQDSSALFEPGGDVVTGFRVVQPEVARLDGATGAEIWRTTLAGSLGGGAIQPVLVGLAAAGELLAAAEVENIGTGDDVAVVKLDAATGAELWRQDIDGGGSGQDTPLAIRADSAGDVYMVGRLADDFAIVKLASATGAELWRRTEDGTATLVDFDAAASVGVDTAGDVVVAGSIVNLTSMADVLVLKLAGADGAEIWRRDIDGPSSLDDGVSGVVVDGADDVFLAGFEGRDLPIQPELVVRKLDGISGADVWRFAESSGYANALAIEPTGDVVVAGEALDAVVIRVDGITGSLLWRLDILGSAGGHGTANAASLALDGLGGALVAGTVESRGHQFPILFAAKVDVTTGSERWRREFPGDFAGDVAIAADGAGDAVVAAETFRHRVRKLVGSSGGDVLPTGKRLQLRDRDGLPIRRRLTLVARDENIGLPPVGSAGDPTLAAGSLVIRNPITAEIATFALPAASWTALGSPPGKRGYRYRDTALANGPCSKVQLGAGSFSARCAGDQIGFTLDEASQGTLVAELIIGTGALRHCIVFGGLVQLDEPAIGNDPGFFFAVSAPQALSCP